MGTDTSHRVRQKSRFSHQRHWSQLYQYTQRYLGSSAYTADYAGIRANEQAPRADQSFGYGQPRAKHFVSDEWVSGDPVVPLLPAHVRGQFAADQFIEVPGRRP